MHRPHSYYISDSAEHKFLLKLRAEKELKRAKFVKKMRIGPDESNATSTGMDAPDPVDGKYIRISTSWLV